MIRVVHPGSGSCFLPIPDPGSRGQKGATLVMCLENFHVHVHDEHCVQIPGAACGEVC
jgi:hypothetical protein